MTRIRHVVFDIGHVLLHWDPEIPFRSLIPDEADRKWFLAEVCSPDWNREQDRGRPWAEAEELLIGEHPDLAEYIRAYRTRHLEMFPFTYEDTVTILKRLVAQGIDVTMLTNFNHETYDDTAKQFDFLGYARGVTVSGAIKMLKPDAEIYAHHSMQFELEPSETLFIDDNAANVAGAQDFGWHAVVFTGADRLEADLTAYQLVAAETDNAGI
ncbi:MAG: HAD family hydrolase [Alphaproteobacteria bacterium]